MNIILRLNHVTDVLDEETTEMKDLYADLEYLNVEEICDTKTNVSASTSLSTGNK